MKKIFPFLAIWLLAGNCSKNNSGENDKEAPLINFAGPLNNQVFMPGQTITITGTITDNKYIAEVHIHVTNIATGTKYLDVHLYPGASSTNFSNQDLTAATGINYKVEVIAKDRAANESLSSVEISCN